MPPVAVILVVFRHPGASGITPATTHHHAHPHDRMWPLGTRAQNVSWQHGGWVGHEDHNFSPLKTQSSIQTRNPLQFHRPTPYNVGLVSPSTTALGEMGLIHAPAEVPGSKFSRLAFHPPGKQQ